MNYSWPGVLVRAMCKQSGSMGFTILVRTSVYLGKQHRVSGSRPDAGVLGIAGVDKLSITCHRAMYLTVYALWQKLVFIVGVSLFCKMKYHHRDVGTKYPEGIYEQSVASDVFVIENVFKHMVK